MIVNKKTQLTQNDEAINNEKKLVKICFQMRTHVEKSISHNFLSQQQDENKSEISRSRHI